MRLNLLSECLSPQQTGMGDCAVYPWSLRTSTSLESSLGRILTETKKDRCQAPVLLGEIREGSLWEVTCVLKAGVWTSSSWEPGHAVMVESLSRVSFYTPTPPVLQRSDGSTESWVAEPHPMQSCLCTVPVLLC